MVPSLLPVKLMFGVIAFICIFHYSAFVVNAEPLVHECGHADMSELNHVIVHPAKSGNSRQARSRRSTGGQDKVFTEQLTISVHYDDSVYQLPTDTVKQIQNSIIPKLIEYFESALKVRPLPGPIFFNRNCNGNHYVSGHDPPYCVHTCRSGGKMCGTAKIPDDHVKVCRQCNGNRVYNRQYDKYCEEIGGGATGVDANYALYVSSVTSSGCPKSSSSSSSTAAFAGTCEMESEFDRPIGGYINFCPVSILKGYSDHHLLNIAKHEFVHALGFSKFLYMWFRDENGEPRSPRYYGYPYETSTNTLKTVKYYDWSTSYGAIPHSVSMLVTPKLVEEARKHFNCPTLEGLEVENQGGSGSAGSHWEARLTMGEVMNALVFRDSKVVISRMTLALLEDSGWYKPDYKYADPLLWGRGAGCAMAAGSCKGYIDSQNSKGESTSPFTDVQPSQFQARCDLLRDGLGYSNLGTLGSSLPYEYRYFGASNKGGDFHYTDYCPFYLSYSRCDDVSKAKPKGLYNSHAETYGPGSRCVLHGTAWKTQQGSRYIQQQLPQAGCYKYSCDNEKVVIYIMGQAYSCSTPGEELKVSQTSDGVTYTGSIICPSCLEICYDDFKNCPEAAKKYSEFASFNDEIPGDAVGNMTHVKSILTSNT